jgi:hypothetical protein
MPRAPKILEYNKMKAADLKKLCEQRDIQCKLIVKDMVEALKLEEEGKWVFHTEQEKLKRGGYIIKIDYRNKEHLIKMGQLVEKGLSRRMEIYSMYRVWYKMETEFIQSQN